MNANLPMSISDGALSPEEMQAQIQLIQQHMRRNMVAGEHYGVIPGCGDKKVLMKAGAEKLAFVFRLAPKFDVEMRELSGGHREYEVMCSITHAPSGTFFGQGVGMCSSAESKYRWRTESTGRQVPKEYWDSRDSELLGGPGFSAKKAKNGQWFISRKVENPDIADQFNTVLKMAKKRALVDAILGATACSDIFTQDLDEGLEGAAQPTEETKPAPRKTYKQAPPQDREGPPPLDDSSFG